MVINKITLQIKKIFSQVNFYNLHTCKIKDCAHGVFKILKNAKEIKSLQNEEICGIYSSIGYSTNECPNIPIFHEEANVMNNPKKLFASSLLETYKPR